MNQISIWDRQPLETFREFVRSKEFAATRERMPGDADPTPISEESAMVYCFMFQKFCSWMSNRHLKMSTLDGQAILQFLERRGENGQLELTSRIAFRYLRLIERCFTFLNVHPNPAKAAMLDAVREQRSLGRNKEMIVLTPEQEKAFVDALPPADQGWKRHRDRAMQILMLFGGVRVAEAIGFMVNEFSGQRNLDGSLGLHIKPDNKHQSSYAHHALLRAEGVDEVLRWLEQRKRLNIAGELAFPANLAGEKLNKTTVYRQVRSTFTRAGLDPAHAGGRTLRNSYAMRDLDNASILELKEHLGLALARSTDVYVDAKLALEKPNG